MKYKKLTTEKQIENSTLSEPMKNYFKALSQAAKIMDKEGSFTYKGVVHTDIMNLIENVNNSMVENIFKGTEDTEKPIHWVPVPNVPKDEEYQKNPIKIISENPEDKLLADNYEKILNHIINMPEDRE